MMLALPHRVQLLYFKSYFVALINYNSKFLSKDKIKEKKPRKTQTLSFCELLYSRV